MPTTCVITAATKTARVLDLTVAFTFADASTHTETISIPFKDINAAVAGGSTALAYVSATLYAYGQAWYAGNAAVPASPPIPAALQTAIANATVITLGP